jgi:CPA2 family monovalent cation:H+ antiporter-2
VRADGYLVLRGISRESDSFRDGLRHLHDFEISTFRLGELAPLAGKSLAQIELRKKYGVTVLTIRRDSQMLPNPEPDMQLLANDLLIVMGTPDNLRNSLSLFKNPEIVP